MTAQQSKAYRSALVRIIRNAGHTDLDSRNHIATLQIRAKAIGETAPSLVSAHLTRLIKQRKGVWERYNNTGPHDETAMNACDARCDALQTTVDAILALFGIEADWGVGLYPVYTVNGYEEHDLTLAIRESGKVAR